MLAALHRVPVAAGDAILVPAGTLHAIGGGILLLELQEPTDLSVLVEWKRFGVDDGSEHLELGWDTALRSLDREPVDPAALSAPRRSACSRARPTPTSAPSACAAATSSSPRSPSCSSPDGEGALDEHGRLRRGTTVLCRTRPARPHVSGDVEALRCLPPSPTAGEGNW